MIAEVGDAEGEHQARGDAERDPRAGSVIGAGLLAERGLQNRIGELSGERTEQARRPLGGGLHAATPENTIAALRSPRILCDPGGVAAHIVVVEDEPVTRALLKAYLEGAGFRVSSAEDATTLRVLLRNEDVDLVLLDIELPGEHGLQIGATLRATSNVGLIFVTRRGDVADRVRGLELGADDYIAKPPDMRELVARVRAVLRRRENGARDGTQLGTFRFDRGRCCLVGAAGEETALTLGESAVLVRLLEAQGKVVPRAVLVEALSAAVHGSNARSVDVLVHRLRRKLGEGGSVEPHILLTVHGVGYRVASR